MSASIIIPLSLHCQGVDFMKKRKDGRYCKTATIDGKRVFFYSNAVTEREAEKDIQTQMLTYSQDKYAQKHNFKQIADRVIQYKEETTAHNTSEMYKHTLKHLDVFYNRNIEDIKPYELQSLLNQMAQTQYSKSAISKVKVLYSLILKQATLEGVEFQSEYFLKSITIPKTPKSKITAPDEKVIKAIIDSGDEWAMCLLFTGLRRGELAALQKQDIDFDNNVIHINRSIEFIHNQPHVKATPKTEASIGDVPILSIVKPVLLHRTQLNPHPQDFLFGGWQPLTETKIKKRWAKFCHEIGFIIKAHQLRHAYANILYQSGVDAKTAQRLLRHANFSTTMDIYTDFAKNVTDEAVNRINSYVVRQTSNPQ